MKTSTVTLILLLVVFCCVLPAHSALTDELVFYAPFDDSMNNTVANQHIANQNGFPSISSDSAMGSGSLYLNGDDYLTYNDSSTGGDLHLRDNDWTMAAWVNIDDQVFKTRFNMFIHDNGQFQWYFMLHSSWHRYVTIYTSTKNPEAYWQADGTAIDKVDTWNHIAVTMDRNSGADDGVTTLWLNGSPVAAYNAERSETVFGGQYVQIGGDGMPGKIDDLGIWHRALSEDEIAYISSNPIPEPVTISLLLAGAGLCLFRRK